MSRYKIDNLNYMSSGARRGFIDMHVSLADASERQIYLLSHDDESLSSGIMTESGQTSEVIESVIANFPQTDKISALSYSKNDKTLLLANEKQDFISADMDEHSNPPVAVQIFPKPGYVSLSVSETTDYQLHRHERAIYEFEKRSYENTKTVYQSSGNQILPLNDVIDTTVKTYIYKTDNMVNPYIPENVGGDVQSLYNEQHNNDRFDIYYSIDDLPVGFCQINNMSYMVTQPSITDAYYLSTSIREALDHGDYVQQYGYSVAPNQFETYLYQPRPENGTYGAQLSVHEVTDERIRKIFEPVRTVQGIEYNHILKLKQQDDVMVQMRTDYEDGNIFGMPFTAKNMYNACYTMDMLNGNTFVNCREYCGVGNSGDHPYLKFYDDIQYDVVRTENNELQTSIVKKQNINENSRRPYQKIEYMYEVAGSTKIRHKSTLFSIKLNDTGLSEQPQDSVNVAKMKANIRQDITNSIRSFVDEICPANTQLFKVYFNN